MEAKVGTAIAGSTENPAASGQGPAAVFYESGVPPAGLYADMSSVINA